MIIKDVPVNIPWNLSNKSSEKMLITTVIFKSLATPSVQTTELDAYIQIALKNKYD